ncbi:hypothetical protein NDU88_002088 [Pleurodeles waltl]|uniref:Uncharacterized protein n=1 Tax=Pleurodeles waltl TaxID=8319 RepID=A0AAV7T2H5_PLEWA|nr:hypothetical protein NDU88_002088 [Pleurodeles waltl]
MEGGLGSPVVETGMSIPVPSIITTGGGAAATESLAVRILKIPQAVLGGPLGRRRSTFSQEVPPPGGSVRELAAMQLVYLHCHNMADLHRHAASSLTTTAGVDGQDCQGHNDHLSFGVSSAADLFQDVIQYIIQPVVNAFKYSDDIDFMSYTEGA